MAIGSPVAEYRVFLCPTNMTLPPSGGKCPDWTIYAWLGGPVDNGCFGDPVDPSYAYVYAYNPCDSPGNCGAQCASGAPRP